MVGPPIVAIVGGTGFVGSFLTTAFLDAMREGRVKEVRLLLRKGSSNKGESSENIQELKGLGVTLISDVDYGRKECVIQALRNVDVVISALNPASPGTAQAGRVLLEAMVMAGVDVYFPSEWGTNHYSKRMNGLDHGVFTQKKNHWREAGLKPGLKRVRLHCSMIMESTFGSWAGLDCKLRVWRIPGNGDTPVGITSKRDIGRFAVEAALLALTLPDKVPESLEVVGDIASLKEYAEMLDKVYTEKKTKLLKLSYEDALTKQSISGDFLSLFPLLFQVGALALEPQQANGNILLNPKEQQWKLKTFTEFAIETGGIPQ